MFHNKCVIGGFGNNNTDLICVGSKKEIQDYVEQIVDEAGTTGVIIGADCTLHLDTPMSMYIGYTRRPLRFLRG